MYNRLGNIMENGDTLNPRHESWTEDLTVIGGYPTPLSGLSVPFPGHPSEYLYFHQRAAPVYFSPVIGRKFLVRDVYYTHIDMEANGGLGRVISKNNPLYEDFSTGTGLTKMGDNQGWWLVHGTFASNIYYTYVVDSTGGEFTSCRYAWAKYLCWQRVTGLARP
ncbi:MAG: hypothetical protein SH848_08030 [Saprospiraceae bacterium]|nr:hypothetical protein [Saprospiraceae bacterium]